MAATGKRGDHPIWDYFAYQTAANGDITTNCTTGNCKWTGKGKVQTNLMRHLDSKHSTEAEQFRKKYEEHCGKRDKEKAPPSGLVGMDAFLCSPTAAAAMNKKKVVPYDRASIRQRSLLECMTRAFCSAGLPYRLVENSDFRSFISELDPQFSMPMSHTTISKYVGEQFAKVSGKLKAALVGRPLVVILDIWSKRGLAESFLGVTVSFYFKPLGAIKTALLACRSFPHPHNAGAILKLVKDIVDEYELEEEQIERYMADNASNVIAAFRGSAIVNMYKGGVGVAAARRETGHRQGGEGGGEAAGTSDDGPTYANFGFEEEAPDIPYDPSLYLPDSNEGENLDVSAITTELQNLPKLLNCSDHSLTLAVGRGCQADNAYTVLERELLALIGKFKHSSAATEEIKALTGVSLANCASTRWLYMAPVAQRALDLQGPITNISGRKKWQITFTWATVAELVDLLMPFFRAVTRLEASNTSTGGLLVPALLNLRRKCDQAAQGYFSVAALQIKTELDRRFSKFLDPNNAKYDPIYLVCAVVNPAAAIRLGDLFEEARDCLRNYIAGVVDETGATLLDAGEAADPSEELLDDGTYDDDLFGDLPARKRVKTADPTKRVWERELDAYFSYLDSYGPGKSIDHVKLWMESGLYPTLRPIIEKILVICATSASCERAFSMARFVTERGRNVIKAANLQAEVIYRYNKFLR
jgi:hypothetical protein